jgi:hypothetical protein
MGVIVVCEPDEFAHVTVIGTVTPEWIRAFALDAAAAMYRSELIRARWAREDARKSAPVARPPLSGRSSG